VSQLILRLKYEPTDAFDTITDLRKDLNFRSYKMLRLKYPRCS